jgi:antirestriction protein ArdC
MRAFHPEDKARSAIDARFVACGWLVQSRDEMNLSAGIGVAVREFATASGPVDYALFVDKRFCGAVEAKPAGTTLSGFSEQAARYIADAPDFLGADPRQRLARTRGWATPRFLTYKQALKAGGNVRKGEHGTKVYFVKQLQIKNGEDEEAETRLVPMLREYTVFNVEQCENLPARILAPASVKLRNHDARDATIDEFLACSGADIREGFGEAYYRPNDDCISLPRFEAFKSAAHYYGTAFHELGHWTGHKSRLDRDLRLRFGERAYAAEELVAELCAAFLCAEFSIDGDLRHAGYIESWIGLLKGDRRAFFTACSKAQAAADYLRGLALAEGDRAKSVARDRNSLPPFAVASP